MSQKISAISGKTIPGFANRKIDDGVGDNGPIDFLVEKVGLNLYGKSLNKSRFDSRQMKLLLGRNFMMRVKRSLFMLAVLLCLIPAFSGCDGGGIVSPKSWHHPESLSDNISPAGVGLLASNPQVALNNNGNAIIVWEELDAFTNRSLILKSEYRNGAWIHPTNLSDHISQEGTKASNPQVSMDDSGNAIIVWVQSDGTNVQVFKSECRNDEWQHPTSLSDNISPDGTDAYGARVIMANNGNAIIIWGQFAGVNNRLFKSEYRNGAWNHPVSLSDNIGPVSWPNPASVAMDNNGRAMIVWVNNVRVYKSEYLDGTWIHPTDSNDYINQLSSSAAPEMPQVAMDNYRSAIIAWHQGDDNHYRQIFKSEYRNGIWTHPAYLSDNISPDGSDAQYPRVAMDDNGNAIIVWSNSFIFKSEYRNGSWTNPSTSPADKISHEFTYAYSPQVAMDGKANSVIVWIQSAVDNYQLFKSEYHKGVWTYPVNLSDHISLDSSSVSSARVVMNKKGNAIIVWEQSDRIYISEYR